MIFLIAYDKIIKNDNNGYMKVTHYKIQTEKGVKLRIAVVADLHGCVFDRVIDEIKKSRPDIIAVPGDLTNKREETVGSPCFLSEAAKIAPTFYSIGNHERKGGFDRESIEKSGAILLDDGFTELNGVFIGGLSSGFEDEKQGNLKKTPKPELDWLDAFARCEGYKILLSHHPEYYPAYLKNVDCDLILSGHAHGGQWRFFGRGVFAPGQGLFPKYTSGIYDGKLVVSRGLCNHTPIPRIFNPTELLIVDVNK